MDRTVEHIGGARVSRRHLLHSVSSILAHSVLAPTLADAAALSKRPSPDKQLPASMSRNSDVLYGQDTLAAGIRSRLIDNNNGVVMHILEAGHEDPRRPCVLHRRLHRSSVVEHRSSGSQHILATLTVLSRKPRNMAYALNVEHVDTAFSSGTLPNDGKPVTFRTVDIGRVVVTTGLLAATDPFMDPEPPPFAQKVPNGEHPVSLAIAGFKSGDERVAFARVMLSAAPAVHWTMAVWKGQDIESLKENHLFGYGVDSGTGAFLHPRAGKLLSQKMDEDEGYFDFMVEEMRKTYYHTRSWLDCRPYPEHPENVVCFSNGWGDGTYPSFFGFSADGRPSALITDCLLLKG